MRVAVYCNLQVFNVKMLIAQYGLGRIERHWLHKRNDDYEDKAGI